AVLDKNPADAEANLAVGRWRAFYKNDWPTGLPLLAKGSDEKLKSLAAEELKSPTDAEQQIQLADAWWNISEKEAGIARDCVRLHAGSIYQEALPSLASALKKAAIEKRLKEIANLKQAPAPVAVASIVGKLDYAVNEFSWKLGQPSVQLIQKNNGFCFLSSISGHFGGYGEAASVHLANDGFWTLDAHAKTDGLAAKALSIEHLTPAIFKRRFTEYHWRTGEPPVKMLHKDEGICFLSGIEGHFEGGGEEVSVRLADDGYWYLGGRSGQDQLGAAAVGVEWARPGAHRIDVEEHKWSVGDSPVELLKKRQGFAFLSSVSGHLWGYGEEVGVYLGTDDTWYFGGRSGQPDVHATATTIRFSKSATSEPPHRAAGEPLAPSSTPANVAAEKASGSTQFPVGQWVGLLHLIDPNRDSVKGVWRPRGQELACEPGKFSRIQVPVVVDGGYDLEVEFTRTSGDDAVATMFAVGSHVCMVNLGGWKSAASGLMNIDGHEANDPQNPFAVRPGSLENNRRHRPDGRGWPSCKRLMPRPVAANRPAT
ncbi:MAG TPA: hypothetical protein VHX65_08730, partial [Pirellulales bacterium]|nr:hypothetical protein [Pirellulales bacterium]